MSACRKELRFYHQKYISFFLYTILNNFRHVAYVSSRNMSGEINKKKKYARGKAKKADALTENVYHHISGREFIRSSQTEINISLYSHRDIQIHRWRRLCCHEVGVLCSTVCICSERHPLFYGLQKRAASKFDIQYPPGGGQCPIKGK